MKIEEFEFKNSGTIKVTPKGYVLQTCGRRKFVKRGEEGRIRLIKDDVKESLMSVSYTHLTLPTIYSV